MGIAFTQYTQDADENYPCANAGDTNQRGWATQIYPYVKAAGAFACPDDATGAPKISYGMNYAIFNGTSAGNWTENKGGMVIALLQAPASTVLLYDASLTANGGAGVDSCDVANLTKICGYANGNKQDISDRHDKGSTNFMTEYLATDGHVKFVRAPNVSFFSQSFNGDMVSVNNLGVNLLTMNYK